MNNIWERNYTLRSGDFDKFDRIKPSAVLDLFQDAAGRHAEEIGVGFEEMISRSYLWVITRVKFKIISEPNRFQNLIVKTWPLAPNRLSYRREYCIENEKGEKLIVGSSEWVVVHSEKRRFLSVPDLYNFENGFYPEMMFEAKLGKVHDFEAEGDAHIVNAGFSELDVNNHVNNTKYANYVIDAIVPSKEDILEVFQIDYRKEVFEGTQLNIYYKRDDNNILAKGQNTTGDTMFACEIQLKK
ncbi:MAG: hypothetical protein IKD04_05860 [Clostridia bacterium]|nr:hypothetical protein [Clostridia bacterium]